MISEQSRQKDPSRENASSKASPLAISQDFGGVGEGLGEWGQR